MHSDTYSSLHLSNESAPDQGGCFTASVGVRFVRELLESLDELVEDAVVEVVREEYSVRMKVVSRGELEAAVFEPPESWGCRSCSARKALGRPEMIKYGTGYLTYRNSKKYSGYWYLDREKQHSLWKYALQNSNGGVTQYFELHRGHCEYDAHRYTVGVCEVEEDDFEEETGLPEDARFEGNTNVNNKAVAVWFSADEDETWYLATRSDGAYPVRIEEDGEIVDMGWSTYKPSWFRFNLQPQWNCDIKECYSPKEANEANEANQANQANQTKKARKVVFAHAGAVTVRLMRRLVHKSFMLE